MAIIPPYTKYLILSYQKTRAFLSLPEDFHNLTECYLENNHDIISAASQIALFGEVA
jgi:hypothetical protein